MAEEKEPEQIDAYMGTMELYQKIYDFLLYIYPILAQFPKFEKFALQTQIKTAIFEMLKDVIRFKKTGTKSHIYAADVELQQIKTLIRLSYDLQYKAISKHRYEVISRHTRAIGGTMNGVIEAVKAGELDRETFNRKYQSRLGHMGHADTYHVTKAIEYDLLFWEFEQTKSGLLIPV